MQKMVNIESNILKIENILLNNSKYISESNIEKILEILKDEKTIIYLLENNKLDLLNKLFLRDYLDPNHIIIHDTTSGCTILYFSILLENYDLVDLLLYYGANPNKGLIYHKDHYHHPLISAWGKRNYDILELLLRNGADPSYANYDNFTVLRMATDCYHNNPTDKIYDICELFMLYKADVNIEDYDVDGNCALDFIKRNKKLQNLYNKYYKNNYIRDLLNKFKII